MENGSSKILAEIRDEIRATREELRGEVKATREELRGEIKELGARIDVQAEGITQLVGFAERHEQATLQLVREVTTINERIDHFLTGAHKDAHDEDRRRMDDLESRVARLEQEPRRAG